QQKVARGQRLSAQPLVPVDSRASPEKGDRRRCSARFGYVEKSSRAFSARGMFGKFPGAARSGACPWLPSAAPPARVRPELKCPNSSLSCTQNHSVATAADITFPSPGRRRFRGEYSDAVAAVLVSALAVVQSPRRREISCASSGPASWCAHPSELSHSPAP